MNVTLSSFTTFATMRRNEFVNDHCTYRYGHYGFSKFSDNFVVLFGVGL